MKDVSHCAEQRKNLDDAELGAQLAALSHSARIGILRYLAQTETSCCGEVVGQLDLAQSTVSQHLKVLVAAGLVCFEADGPRSRYAINRQVLQAVADELACFASACCVER
ncbi:ArsR/SmtB family transcription factor [Aquamicrobium segne]|uniref:ArsR/SmtB family transcription factor n=1 Tax=Aquamicrobium segne TaxID=469547 RepID=A0ABW0GWE3_9HYPH